MSPLLLFLDFDGVLHSRTGQTPFQRSSMEALACSLSAYPVEIVIASTWRESVPFKILYQELSVLGKPVVGITPILDDPFIKNVRFHEILLYLEQKNQSSRPWFALDDTPGFFPKTAPVYWTDPSSGFTSADIEPLSRFIDCIIK